VRASRLRCVINRRAYILRSCADGQAVLMQRSRKLVIHAPACWLAMSAAYFETLSGRSART